MAGPLMAVARALLGSELAQPVINKLVSSGALDPGVTRLLRGESLGSTLTQAAEPLGRLAGVLPAEPPNYNLPTDYGVGSRGEVYSSAGDRMVAGRGISGFQPESPYGTSLFEEPRYEPPLPQDYSLRNAGQIPSQVPMGAPVQEFPPQRAYSFERDVGGTDFGSGSVPLPSAPVPPEGPYWNPTLPAQYELGRQELPMQNLSAGLPSAVPAETTQQELERLAARYAGQPDTAQADEDEAPEGGAVWWPRAPQVDPRFLQQQQAQQR